MEKMATLFKGSHFCPFSECGASGTVEMQSRLNDTHCIHS